MFERTSQLRVVRLSIDNEAKFNPLLSGNHSMSLTADVGARHETSEAVEPHTWT